MEAICECKYNHILYNDLIEENVLLSNTLGDLRDIISISNIDVFKCYKDVFDKKIY